MVFDQIQLPVNVNGMFLGWSTLHLQPLIFFTVFIQTVSTANINR